MKNTGKFKKGQIKVANDQRKKHISQIMDKEIERIKRRVNSLPDCKLHHHVLRKVENDGLIFQPAAIVAVLKNISRNNIVEYNITPSYYGESHRVLLRSEEEYLVDIEGNETICNICFVLCLDKGTIITVYWNESTDNHEKIDWDRYNQNLKVV